MSSDSSIFNLYGFNGAPVYPVQSSTSNILITKGTLKQIAKQLGSVKEILELDIASGQTSFYIQPSANKTIVTSNTTTFSNDFTIYVYDVSNCSIGDELIFIFNNTSHTVAKNVYFRGQFYATFCGGGSYTPAQQLGHNTRNVVTFIFDGEFFSNTYDNC
jgi:hypothetical protein